MPTIANKAPEPPARAGARELSRRNSQTKLIAAARQLFVELGYEATTVRKIAQVSGLGMGTVFHYIDEKRDLIYLIFNEEADERTDKAFAALQSWQTFRAKVLTVVEAQYQHFALEPELGRILLSEINHVSPGRHYLRHVEVRSRQMAGVQRLVADALQSGEIRSDASAETISRTIFFAYSAAARWWINSADPTWRNGVKEFSEVFDVILGGLGVVKTPPK